MQPADLCGRPRPVPTGKAGLCCAALRGLRLRLRCMQLKSTMQWAFIDTPGYGDRPVTLPLQRTITERIIGRAGTSGCRRNSWSRSAVMLVADAGREEIGESSWVERCLRFGIGRLGKAYRLLRQFLESLTAVAPKRWRDLCPTTAATPSLSSTAQDADRPGWCLFQMLRVLRSRGFRVRGRRTTVQPAYNKVVVAESERSLLQYQHYREACTSQHGAGFSLDTDSPLGSPRE